MYFNRFPLMAYDIKGTSVYKLVPDIYFINNDTAVTSAIKKINI